MCLEFLRVVTVAAAAEVMDMRGGMRGADGCAAATRESACQVDIHAGCFCMGVAVQGGCACV